MLFVIVAIGSTDLLFALDSIPATFGVTSECVLGVHGQRLCTLRATSALLLLKVLLDRLVYLSLGPRRDFGLHWNQVDPHVGTRDVEPGAEDPHTFSLGVIALILVIATVASLIKSRQDPTLTAHAGTSVTKPDRDEG